MFESFLRNVVDDAPAAVTATAVKAEAAEV
jgi:hypothetical protein